MSALGKNRVLNEVSGRLAKALIGRAVTLRVGERTVNGVVTGTITGTGLPRLVVRGADYGLHQVLTVIPSGYADCMQG